MVPSAKRLRIVFLCASALLIVFASALRIHHITQRSLWFDEAVAANISRGTVAETLSLTRREDSAPITHPLILNVVDKVADGPFAVRFPSLVASILAVCVMLCFAKIPSIRYETAAMAALMLAISATQIRYAQEVREYSLSVLWAAVLLYLFIAHTSTREKNKAPIALYVALFLAPLVQYGLVLFSAGILAALFILSFRMEQPWAELLRVVRASMFLTAGGLLSYFLTLRYQWSGRPWYLEGDYFAPGSSLLHFIRANTHSLLTFLLPGQLAALISALAIVFYLVRAIRARTVSPLLVLAITSFGVVLIGSIVRVYPYGGIRQCLFLAPVLGLLAAESLVQVANEFSGVVGKASLAAICCLVVLSGVLQFRSVYPYAEVEDIQTVLHALQNHIEPGDNTYVYSGAVPAVDFYLKDRDSRFTYGDFHRGSPEQYSAEMLADLRPGTGREWILFSHIYQHEDQRILDDVSKDWEVKPVLFATGTALYLACRGPAIACQPSSPVDENDWTAPDAIQRPSRALPAHDSFWDWNIRNSAATVPKTGSAVTFLKRLALDYAAK